MKWLPYETFDLTSESSPAELVGRWQNHLSSAASGNRDFSGTVTEAGFQLRPMYLLLKPFTPVVWGRFDVDDRRTTIHVEMVPSPRWLLWLTCPSILFNVLIFRVGWSVIGWSIGLLILTWYFSMLSIWGDAGRARQKLAELFC
ncbi:MAG: hypothetical protein ACKVT0_22685 [Planctomycetaceae bacterium]